MPAAGRFSPHVKAVLGPTNTGKTHLAIERMLAHGSGMIGAPLRLLAREIYDRVVREKGEGAAALVTGEEKITPESARYFVCTVEAMPLSKSVEFLAVDEIQVARDPDRGHVFTDRLMHARGRGETMLLGAETMRPMIRRLLPGAEVTHRERLSQLSYAGPIKITKLPKRSAVVAFSAEEVYAIAELLRRQRGGAAVVMGALSPRTRNAQVALYQSGEVDFLVATDAIGMGLNMDIDHVAFASRSKFDGARQRLLWPEEIAQIAGRAGRYQRDGSFGETGDCAPFDLEMVERVEAHEFEPVEQVQWRSTDLSFDSVAALLASLATPPNHAGLRRVRGAEDEETLKRLAEDAEIAALVTSPSAVKRLWDACQMPDFRKASIEEHARLVGRIALHLLSAKARIPEEWAARELEKLDRPEGDLDALQARLAHVRTWAYVSNRSDWLIDHEHWRGRARDIEDRLSDALHAALAQRFVDRRTSALLKGLKRNDAMLAGVSSEGEVTVEGHYVGRLVGLEFQPDPRADGLEGRALRHAALRALAPEVARRLSRIARGEAEGLEFDRSGRVCVAGAPAARLIAGPSLLKPRLELIGAEAASLAERGAALERLELWLMQTIAAELAPLAGLESAWREARVSGAARGVAFRLIEQSGALDCAELAAGELTAEARAELRALGVRVGRHSVFLPALIKPRPARLLALLSRCARGGHEADLFLPRPGALSAEIERPLGWAEAAAAGYRPLGRVAVRFDRVEVLAAALARNESPPAEAELARLVGRPTRELADLLGALGYRRLPAAEGEDGAAPRWRAPKPASKAARVPAMGPFAVLAGLAGDGGETPRPRRKRGRA